MRTNLTRWILSLLIVHASLQAQVIPVPSPSSGLIVDTQGGEGCIHNTGSAIWSLEEQSYALKPDDASTTLYQVALAQRGNWVATKTIVSGGLASSSFSTGYSADTSSGNPNCDASGNVVLVAQNQGTQLNSSTKANQPNTAQYYNVVACKGPVQSGFTMSSTNCAVLKTVTVSNGSGPTGESYLDPRLVVNPLVSGHSWLLVDHRYFNAALGCNLPNGAGAVTVGGNQNCLTIMDVDFTGAKPTATTLGNFDTIEPGGNHPANGTEAGCAFFNKPFDIVLNADGLTWTVYTISNVTVAGWSGVTVNGALSSCGASGWNTLGPIGQAGIFSFQLSVSGSTGTLSAWTQIFPTATMPLVSSNGWPVVYTECWGTFKASNAHRIAACQSNQATDWRIVDANGLAGGRPNLTGQGIFLDLTTGSFTTYADIFSPGSLWNTTFGFPGGGTFGQHIGGMARASIDTVGDSGCPGYIAENVQNANSINYTWIACLAYPGSQVVTHATIRNGVVLRNGAKLQ